MALLVHELRLPTGVRNQVQAIVRGVTTSQGPAWAIDAVRNRYEKLNALLPRGTPILARVSHPFLLDFSGRPIYIVDIPGAASPPPGLPNRVEQTADELNSYLRNQGVGFVLWEYGTESSFSRREFSGLQRHPGTLVRTGAINAFVFQDKLEALRKSRPVVLDVDGIALIKIE